MMIQHAVFLAVMAGLINGLYAYPISRGSIFNSYIWICFALLAFILIPSGFLIWFYITNGITLPSISLIMMVATGIIYGLGTYLVAQSMHKIGIGIPFSVSLSLGTLTGSLYSSIIMRELHINISLLFVYILFLLAIVLYAYATSIRDKNTHHKPMLGLVLCIVGSILQATQGACLSYYANEIKLLGSSIITQFIPWTLIYIPCGIVFIALNLRTCLQQRIDLTKLNLIKILRSAVGMAGLNITSVCIYTFAIGHTALFAEKYLWVAFMAAIVLGSTACSFLKREWSGAPAVSKTFNLVAMTLLIAAFLLLKTAI